MDNYTEVQKAIYEEEEHNRLESEIQYEVGIEDLKRTLSSYGLAWKMSMLKDLEKWVYGNANNE